MINLEKSVLHPVKQIEFLGLTIDTKKTTFRSIREKIKACVSTISGDFHAAKNFSPKSHKVNWPAAINCPNLFANRNLVSISSEKTNISSTEKGILKWSCDSNLSREELLWWMENLKLCNGRKFQLREPHMVIQTDASTKWRGHTARKFRQSGNGHRRRSIFT